jgi:HEAT repeat protein
LGSAARSLIQAHNTAAVPRLIRDLRTSRDCEKRVAAAYTLGFLRDRRAAKALVQVLSNRRRSPRLRGQAAEALGYLFIFRPDRLAFATLLEGLEDPSSEVRFWSIFAIGQMGNRKAIPVLAKISQKDKATLPLVVECKGSKGCDSTNPEATSARSWRTESS